jgi:hypothetical protein
MARSHRPQEGSARPWPCQDLRPTLATLAWAPNASTACGARERCVASPSQAAPDKDCAMIPLCQPECVWRSPPGFNAGFGGSPGGGEAVAPRWLSQKLDVLKVHISTSGDLRQRWNAAGSQSREAARACPAPAPKGFLPSGGWTTCRAAAAPGPPARRQHFQKLCTPSASSPLPDSHPTSPPARSPRFARSGRTLRRPSRPLGTPVDLVSGSRRARETSG